VFIKKTIDKGREFNWIGDVRFAEALEDAKVCDEER
jgi:hypothetical protein